MPARLAKSAARANTIAVSEWQWLPVFVMFWQLGQSKHKTLHEWLRQRDVFESACPHLLSLWEKDAVSLVRSWNNKRFMLWLTWNKIISKLFLRHRRRPTIIILFQRVETCLKLFQNYSRNLLQLVNIFQHVQCRWSGFEIISAAEIILFQFQTWLYM